MTDIRARLEAIKEDLDMFFVDHCEFGESYHDDVSSPTFAVKQELRAAQRSLERAINNVQQDYEVLVNVSVSVNVTAHDESEALDQAIDLVEEELYSRSQHDCDVIDGQAYVKKDVL